MRVAADLLVPHLKWHPGKKAQAVRTATSSCLWSLLASSTAEEKKDARSVAITADQLLEVAQALLPAMNGLVEDGADQVRIFICRSIRSDLDAIKAKTHDVVTRNVLASTLQSVSEHCGQ